MFYRKGGRARRVAARCVFTAKAEGREGSLRDGFAAEGADRLNSRNDRQLFIPLTSSPLNFELSVFPYL